MFVTEAVAVPLPLLTVQTWLAGCVAMVTAYDEFGCKVTANANGPLLDCDRLSAPLSCRTRVPVRPAMRPPIVSVSWETATVVVELLLPPQPENSVAKPTTSAESAYRIAKPSKPVGGERAWAYLGFKI